MNGPSSQPDRQPDRHPEPEALLVAVTRGSLTEVQRMSLENLLQTDPAFREAYLSCLEIDAQLHFRSRATTKPFTPDSAAATNETARPHEDPMTAALRPVRQPLRNAGAPTPATRAPETATARRRQPAAPRRVMARAGIGIATTACLLAIVFAFRPQGPDPHPVQVVQPPAQKIIDWSGWTIRLAEGARYQLSDDSRPSPQIRLVSGELFAEPDDNTIPLPLDVETPAGTVTASHSRIYVSSRPDHPGADGARGAPLTRLLVLAGTALLHNPSGSARAGSGELILARAGEAPVRMQQEGNYREAFEVYRTLVVDSAHTGQACAEDLDRVWQCLRHLGRLDEWDPLVEKVVEAHPADWRVLHVAARQYWRAPHAGVLVTNRFYRKTGGGQPVDVSERDRIRALQLMHQAMPHLPAGQRQADDDQSRVFRYYSDLADMVRGQRQSWNLQVLTNIDRLPEYGTPVFRSHNSAPPVDENKRPVFYSLPADWTTAASDGERWRWSLDAMAKTDPAREAETRLVFADFLHGQFGVHTAGAIDNPRLEDGQLPPEGRYTTHTLKPDETIARLATGVRRFELPDDQNFIALYEQVASTPIREPASPLRDLSYRVYHGEWNNLPDFAAQQPVAAGPLPAGLFDLDVAERDRLFGIVFEGRIEIPTDGEFTFGLTSDDGTRLFIDGRQVIDHDGCHEMDEREAKVALKTGSHAIRLEFFQREGREGLILTWQGPGVERQYLSRQRHQMQPQERALEKLACLFENRRQFEKAAACWQQCIERFGAGQQRWRRDRYRQIVGNWLRFETAPTFPAGEKATLGLQFRNATRARFVARRIDIERVIADSKSLLKSDPRHVTDRHHIFNIGRRIVAEGETGYLGEETIEWTRQLDPPAGHWTRHTQVETPLDEPGAWLVEATAGDGNTSRVICWITDTTIVMKRTDQRHLYFVADAMTGQPVAKANVEVFASWSRWDKEIGRHYTRTRNFARFTDADGLVYTDAEDVDDSRYSRIVIARDEQTGRFGMLGDFFHEPLAALRHNPYQSVRAWCVTDRPVYRPGQQVHHKSWVRLAQYDLDHISAYAGKEFSVRVFDPANREVLARKVRTDEFGGLAFDWRLSGDALPGDYQFEVVAHHFTRPSDGKLHEEIVLGKAHFRVEEYKKPEYSVTIEAPAEAVSLGEKFHATIRARYYFGQPVTNASVRYTVRRTRTADTWFPAHPWDWFYGQGHWWWGYDYAWYPGWSRWGLRPAGWFQANPPEVVLENTVPIGEDGTVQIEIDSALAKTRFGDTDHRYQITAEVVDESRRTVTGSGQVAAARHPYQICVWMNGGHYREGDRMQADVQARTANGRGVPGRGEAVLYRIVFDEDGQPSETKVRSWPIETNEDGRASLSIQAERAGQYRLACRLTDHAGRAQEGAALTRIVADSTPTASDSYRFNPLELVLDQTEYQPGQRARLLINTNQPDSTVALFVRPVGGVYPQPKILRLRGKSAVHEIEIARQDMPNIHVEAFTISGGRYYEAARQIAVPPAKRLLTLAVEPSRENYEPGEKARVKLRLSDADGKPFTGSTVVAIYDKSLEAIARSQVADIRSHFWKWQRAHRSHTRIGLRHSFGQLLRHHEPGMSDMGAHWMQNRWGRAGRGRFRKASLYRYGTEDRLADSFGFSQNAYFALEDPRLDSERHFDDRGIVVTGKRIGDGPAVAVRSRFADTALWVSGVTTDENGIAEVRMEMPENLTTWKIEAWSMGHGTRVGHGQAEVITSKEVMVRLQAPRFFTETDDITLSANVHNYTGTARDFRVSIETAGDQIVLADGTQATQTVRVQPDGDRRVDWRVRASREGRATVRVQAESAGGKSDAMQQQFPVFVHGMLRTESRSIAVRDDQTSGMIEFVVPEKRRGDQTVLEVRYSPGIAPALVDALPYLATNPQHSSEATLSRFVPLVVTSKVIADMGIDLNAIRKKHAAAGEAPVSRGSGRHQDRHANPVFDPVAIDRLVARCLRELTTLQNEDGGWGWYAGHDSDPHSTAYVVHGLQIARQNGAAIVPGVVDRGLDWLQTRQTRELKELNRANEKIRPWKARADNTDALVFMVLVEAGRESAEMADFLYRDRLNLSPYCQAMVGLALDRSGQPARRDMVIRNLGQFLEQDDENQTAWLRLNRSHWWNWYNHDIETSACFLKLLCRGGKAADPVAAKLARYLLNNRRQATRWKASRDTALAIEALAEYVRASGESDPDLTVSVLVDGVLKKEVRIGKDNLFTFDNVLRIEGETLGDGKHTVEIRKSGRGHVYANAFLTCFTLEDFITRSGLELRVDRRYYRIENSGTAIPAAGSRGNVVDYQVRQSKRIPLRSGETVESGDLIEVELILESKNDYEYLRFSDRKPAGCEATALHSGHRWLGGVSAYMELRDERVDFFVRHLRRGRHSLTYRLRAEVPGTFSALPATGSGVYTPRLKANSAEARLTVRQQENAVRQQENDSGQGEADQLFRD